MYSLEKYHISSLCNEHETNVRFLGILKEALN